MHSQKSQVKFNGPKFVVQNAKSLQNYIRFPNLFDIRCPSLQSHTKYEVIRTNLKKQSIRIDRIMTT